MKLVFYRIMTALFALLFVVYYILMFPFYVVSLSLRSKSGYNFVHRLNTLWGYVITVPVGIRVKVYGADKIDKKSTYIFAPNHSSYLDIPVCNTVIKNQFRFMGKAELDKVPLFGYMFSRLHVSFRRQSPKAALRAFESAAAHLDEGTSMLIFPEGTIPDKSQILLGRFKEGAFRLAVEKGIPLVPMAIKGADKVFADDKKWLLKPGKIEVHFGEIIRTDDKSLDDIPEIRVQVREFMIKHLDPGM